MAVSPGWISWPTFFMNSSLIPRSVADPARAPRAAPSSPPARGTRKIMPMSNPQKPPERAPLPAVMSTVWRSLTLPFCWRMTMATSSSSRRCFCSKSAIREKAFSASSRE